MNQSPKITLIQPPSLCVNDDRLEPPLGLLYIAAHLIKHHYENTNLLDLSGCKSEIEIDNKISTITNSEFYGISCYSTNYLYTKKIINFIKSRYPASHIIIGGPHPSAMPEFTLKDSGADIVVAGEGENIFYKIISSFDSASKVKGIVRGFECDHIDSYAFPARDLIDMSDYSRKLMGKPAISLLSSRGCRNKCLHCNSVVMRKGDKKVRYRSPGNIIEEIKLIRDQYDHYRFNDDDFAGNPGLNELLEKMNELDITFRIFARLNDLNTSNSILLKKAGCVHISIGIESLCPDNLKIIGKQSQIGLEDNIRIAKDHGLKVRASFIVGLPFDSYDSINHYFIKAARLGIDEFAIYPLIPYPGTTIAKYPEKFGYKIINDNFNEYIQMGINGKTCFALKHTNFGPEDVSLWLNTAAKILQDGGVKHMSESEIA